MFERFTRSARSAVVLSQEAARALGHPRIAAGHVLLAIAHDPTSAGSRALGRVGFDGRRAEATLVRTFADDAGALDGGDAEALRTLGIDVEEVRRAVDAAFGPGALERAGERSRRLGHIPFDPDAKKALELALREALRLGDRHIATEHLLLGLVRDDRSSAADVLRAQGIAPDAVRDAVASEASVPGRPDRSDRSDRSDRRRRR
jgi:ATP-dependent Clp protease ATP-binding subunit ClpA